MLDQYHSLYENYRWVVPEFLNAAEYCCRRWANDRSRVALYFELPNRSLAAVTYKALLENINRLSHGLQRLGIGPGDRVVIGLSSPVKLIITHLAVSQLGAIAVPVNRSLSVSLSDRLRCLSPRGFILDEVHRQAHVEAIRSKNQLPPVITIDFQDERALSWNSLLARQSTVFEPENTRASAPMLLDINDGLQNFMNARVVPQQALIGALPGFVVSQNWAPQQNDLIWIGADWSLVEVWLTAVLPSLYFGLTLFVSASDMPPDQLLDRLDRQAVTNIYGSAPVLAHVAEAAAARISEHSSLRAAAAPPLPQALRHRLESLFKLPVNAIGGFPVARTIVGESYFLWSQRTGSIGKAIPGHQLKILSADQQIMSAGTVGEIAVFLKDRHGHPDPAVLAHNWREWTTQETAILPERAFMMTGCRGYFDDGGFLWLHDEASAT